MKKFGKYEKMPDGTRAMQPAIKRTLLQTYLTSLLCMVLCVAMLFGTTFAWFTSEVTNSGNEIYIGTLDAKLEKLLDNGTWASLDSAEAGSDTKLFDGNVRWEPGYTSMETIKVSNEGDLSFRYALTFTDGLLNGAKNDEELIKVAQFFTVYVHAGEFTDSDPKPASFAEIKTSAESEDGTWRAVKMGEKGATLADILKIELPVLSGSMNAEDVRGDAVSQPALPGPNDSKATAHTYTIALHMNGEVMPDSLTPDEQKQWQDNLNDLMGNKIGLNVKLTAYQQTSEKDAFGPDYDWGAFTNNLADVNRVEDRAINYYWGLNDREHKSVELDAKYQFRPKQTLEQAEVSPYQYYHADYVVFANRDVPVEAVGLAGYYSAWCDNSVINNHWIALTNDVVVEAGQEIPLVEFLGVTVNYMQLCEFGNDGIGFLCGLWDRTAENGQPSTLKGTTITVQLRMYETYSEEECQELFGFKSKNERTGRYCVVGEYTYTF